MPDRTRRPVLALSVLVALALLAAVGAFVIPDAAGRFAGWVAIGLVMAGPLLRVVAAARHWVRPPDRRFLAAVAVMFAALCSGAFIAA